MKESATSSWALGPLVILFSLALIAGGVSMLLEPAEVDSRNVAGRLTDSIRQEHQHVDFSSISTWGSAADGRLISLRGRLHRCDGTEQWLPQELDADPGDFVLYRFVNTCCPGHAVPAVIGLADADHIAGQIDTQDQWVDASGVFHAADSDNPAAAAQLSLKALQPLAEAPEAAAEQLYPPSKMGAPCAGSRPDIPYPLR